MIPDLCRRFLGVLGPVGRRQHVPSSFLRTRRAVRQGATLYPGKGAIRIGASQANDGQACSEVASSLAAGRDNAFVRKRQLDAMEECLLRRRATKLQTSFTGQSIAAVDASHDADMSVLDDDRQKNAADRRFQGLSWGVGFGVSYAFDDIVSEAEIVNGVVRSVENETQQARIVLETHRYLGCLGGDPQKVKRGCGPFGVVTTGADDILAGVGFGFMYGWKAPDEEKGTGFSVGIGAVLDNEIRALADGFDDGKPLPSGETEIRFETEARWSALMFFTRTF